MTEEWHNKIEEYLSGSMNASEQQDFESQLKSNPEFKKAFDEYQFIADALEFEAEEDIKAQLKKIDEEEELKEATTKTSFNKKWIIATAIVGLLIILLSIWKQMSDIKPQQIAQEYGVESHIDKYRSLASEEQFSEQEKEYITKMREASALLDQQKFDEAREVYNSLTDEISIIRENKEWAIAMSHYLESGRKNEVFQKILDSILLNPEHNCYKQAVQVEAEVNSFWGRLKN